MAIDIKILFDPGEGGQRPLYVANGGNPFSHSNFRTICELGLSDKPPGEGIGNKGIGFKSVLQICERPEIYSSSSSESSSFDGFCFSFATDAELLEMLEGDESRLDIIRKETGRFQIPIALDEIPPRVKAFESSELATVVRLPLDRSGAGEEVERELEALVEGHAPVLLFLERLRLLTIEHCGQEAPVILERREVECELSPTSGDVRLIDLGHQGRFLCSTVVIPHESEI